MLRSVQWRNDPMRYGSVSRLLHWLIALFIFIMLGIGWTIDIIPKEWKPVNMGIHKSLGIIILALALFRLAWRFYNVASSLPESMPRWEKHAALAVHFLLYGFLLAMPLTGWAMTSAKGRPVVFLGIVQLPDMVAPDHDLGKQLEELHGTLAYLLAALIVLHVMAALYHHFICKDNVLMRMWPPIKK